MANSAYELELVPIKINETCIELWTVKRWKGVVETVDANDKAYIHDFPLWIKIWEASIVLCEHLSQRDINMNAQILELGAGIGLTGMMLGAKGHHVTLSDYNDDALALLKKNVEHNRFNNVQVKKLDWSQPDTSEMYDIVLGSELIYKEEFIEPLLDLLRNCLKPDGAIFIAHDMNRKNMAIFLNKSEKYFTIQSKAKSLKSNGNVNKIILNTLQFK